MQDSNAGVKTGCPNRCGNNQCGRESSVNLEGGSVNGGVGSTNRDSPRQNKRISKAMLKTPDTLQQAKRSYEENLPAFLHEITTVSSNRELDEACLRFGDILRKPFESNRSTRPDRYRFFWDSHLDSLAKLRSKFYQKWKRRGNMEFWQKYKDLDKLIKRTT